MSKKKNWKICICLFGFSFIFISFFSFSFTFEEDIKSRLNKINKDDQNDIKLFFQQLVSFENFGYVLFGTKPMILTDFCSQTLIINTQNYNTSKVIKYNPICLNYKTWKKYQHLFPMKNFIFRIFENDNDSGNLLIIFINKKKFIETILKNIDLFKNILGNSVQPEVLLHKFETSEDFFEDVFGKSLRGHHGLLGILLGYGTYNSLKFQELDEFKNELKTKFPPPYNWGFVQKSSNLTPFTSYSRNTLIVDLPRFKEDLTCAESIKIHQNYVDTWKYLCEVYSNKDLLEITLESLTK